MKRQIIKIDDDKCTGCGDCIPNCHEGALQIIDGKVRLVSELMCDGLGACLGHCPTGALEIEEREAEPYDEVAVIKEMIPKGKNLITAHLLHLQDHNEKVFLQQGIDYLKSIESKLNFKLTDITNALGLTTAAPAQPSAHAHQHAGGGCPGSMSKSFTEKPNTNTSNQIDIPSHLSHWPIQMHLINPMAGHFKNADMVIAADCSAFSIGSFHDKYLKGKTLAIACPKLDSNKEVYVTKIISLIDDAEINTLSIIIMEVPCCGGLLQLAQMAAQQAKRKVPIKAVTIGIQGAILNERWV